MPIGFPASVGLAWASLAIAVAVSGCAKGEPLDRRVMDHGTDGDGDGGAEDGAAGGGGADDGGLGGGGAPSDGGDATGGMGGAPSTCGDGVVDADELCDDANLVAGDGCDACMIECEDDAVQHPVTGHCYRLFAVAGDQATAEASCQAWGGAADLGHLASFGDQIENDLVAPLATADTWIGADDFGGSFSWIDGTPFGFENWQMGEPNYPGIEHCMFMDIAAMWHDHDCADIRPAYLCERRGAGTF